MSSDRSHKDSGFSLPDDYFGSFEERLKQRLEEQGIEERIPDKEGFKVPEGYFEQLESRILKQTTTPTTKVIPLRPKRRWMYFVAATIALALLSTLFLRTGGNKGSFDSLKLADIEWLLDEGILEIPEPFIIEQSQFTDLDQISMIDITIDRETLENYLADETDLYEVIE